MQLPLPQVVLLTAGAADSTALGAANAAAMAAAAAAAVFTASTPASSDLQLPAAAVTVVPASATDPVASMLPAGACADSTSEPGDLPRDRCGVGALVMQLPLVILALLAVAPAADILLAVLAGVLLYPWVCVRGCCGLVLGDLPKRIGSALASSCCCCWAWPGLVPLPSSVLFWVAPDCAAAVASACAAAGVPAAAQLPSDGPPSLMARLQLGLLLWLRLAAPPVSPCPCVAACSLVDTDLAPPAAAALAAPQIAGMAEVSSQT